jgi:hypothetical protein
MAENRMVAMLMLSSIGRSANGSRREFVVDHANGTARS